tara:strand:- start:2518 stop:3795 length:1278 start_codon:yes stop_codon:yes gene_type:complete
LIINKMSFAPNARFRMYTRLNSYWWFFRDLILGRVNKGNDVEKLEKALAQRFKITEAVCVPQARVGIYLVIKNLIKPGQEVILSPYTVADVINMVVYAGGIPVFVDIEQKTCNINPQEVEQLINDKTGAVLITHLHGIAASAHQILEICQKRHLPMIEDVAQAFGGYQGRRRLGTIGQAGIYSFGRYKNINSWYGGAVVSNDQELISKIRAELDQYRYLGNFFILKRIINGLIKDILTSPLMFKSFVYWIFRYGFLNNVKWINRLVEVELDIKLKNKMPADYLRKYTPFQARLVLSQLNQIDLETKQRIEKARLYYQGLENIPDLVLPIKGNDAKYIYLVFPIQYQKREELLKWLMRHKRDVAAQHLKNCADLPSFSTFYRDCPVARKTANEVIVLPTYQGYPISEVKKNIKVIQSYFTNASLNH